MTYTNGTNNYTNNNITTNPLSLIVQVSGNYVPVDVSDSSGCPADTANITGVASIVFNPAPAVDLGPDTTVCGEYVLNAGSGMASYQWSNGLGTTQSVTVTSSDLYDVTVTDNNGCEGYDEIDVEILPVPNIQIEDTVICEGASHVFNAGGGHASYVWHNGSTSFLFQMDSVGTVSVTVTGLNGCVSEKSAAITAIVPLPTPNVTGTAGLAPVTLDAGAGYAAYDWSNNDTTQTIVVNSPGTYTCTVTDGSGCQGEDSKKAVIWPNSIEEAVQINGFAFYPNPASNQLTLQFSESTEIPVYADIIDMGGRLVHRVPLNQAMRKQEITLPSSLANGEYLVRCIIGNTVVDEPVMIRH